MSRWFEFYSVTPSVTKVTTFSQPTLPPRLKGHSHHLRHVFHFIIDALGRPQCEAHHPRAQLLQRELRAGAGWLGRSRQDRPGFLSAIGRAFHRIGMALGRLCGLLGGGQGFGYGLGNRRGCSRLGTRRVGRTGAAAWQQGSQCGKGQETLHGPMMACVGNPDNGMPFPGSTGNASCSAPNPRCSHESASCSARRARCSAKNRPCSGSEARCSAGKVRHTTESVRRLTLAARRFAENGRRSARSVRRFDEKVRRAAGKVPHFALQARRFAEKVRRFAEKGPRSALQAPCSAEIA